MGSSYTASTGTFVTINVHVKHRLCSSLAQQCSSDGSTVPPSSFRDMPVNLSPGVSFYRSIKQQVILCAHNSGVYESNSFVFSEPFVLCLWNGAQYITIQDSQPVLNGPDVFWITQSHAFLEGKQYCSQLEQVSIAVGHKRVLKKFVNLEVPASTLSQHQWSSKFVMEKTPESFPERFDYMNTGKPVGVWSAARTIFRGLALREAGTPDEAAEQELHEMPFTNCRWLCPEALMDAAVRDQFAASPSQPVTPPSEITMISSFDYLERAFVDLFGAWSPQDQAFKRAFPHDEVEGLYQQSAWLPRMLNRAFDTMPFFSEEFNDVCPWNGAAVFWCALQQSIAYPMQ